MLKDIYCKICKNAEHICKSDNVCCICQKHGIRILPSVVEALKIVGCYSYEYDGKGSTDFERREIFK